MISIPAAMLAVAISGGVPSVSTQAHPPASQVTVPVTIPAWGDGGYSYFPATVCPIEAPYLLNTSFDDPAYLQSGLANGVSFAYEAAEGGVYLEVVSRDNDGYATGLMQGDGMRKNYLTNYSPIPWTVEVTLHCTASEAERYQ